VGSGGLRPDGAPARGYSEPGRIPLCHSISSCIHIHYMYAFGILLLENLKHVISVSSLLLDLNPLAVNPIVGAAVAHHPLIMCTHFLQLYVVLCQSADLSRKKINILSKIP
jgi:hypothetical protein